MDPFQSQPKPFCAQGPTHTWTHSSFTGPAVNSPSHRPNFEAERFPNFCIPAGWVRAGRLLLLPRAAGQDCGAAYPPCPVSPAHGSHRGVHMVLLPEKLTATAACLPVFQLFFYTSSPLISSSPPLRKPEAGRSHGRRQGLWLGVSRLVWD